MVSSPGMNSRWDSFDYICQSCGRCCYDKDVRVNPYEVARLAANRGQTTTEFRAAWTLNKGSISQYLERQGAEPFIQATDEYFKWACAAHASLNDTVAVCDREAGTISLALDLLDIDAVIASHCRDTRQSEPLNLDERKKLHLALLPS